jgi:signal peptide peptidase SppA
MKGKTLLKFITSHPLAILDSYLDVIVSAIEEWPEGNLLKVEATTTPTAGTVTSDGIKILSYSGAMMKNLSGLAALSGGISTRQIQKDIQAALNDTNVAGIVLALDSPGGTVDGTKELADYLMSVRGQKPIVAYADGLMASAAYWIGSCADAIVAYDTTQVGSIGVIMTHFDYSKAAEKEGIKPTVLYAGKYKARGNRYEPLSKDAKDSFQADLDYYYTMFVDHVADARGVTPEEVIVRMAEGRVFIGHKAKEAGLVDEIGGIEDAIKLTLELGGKNVEKKVQEALVKGDLPVVLSALASRDDLTPEVKESITAALTPVEKVEIEKTHYDNLVSEVASLKAKLEETEAHLEEAQSTIETLQVKHAQAEKEATIKALFAESGYEPDDELLATLMDMSEEKAKVLADKFIAQREAVDDLAKSLTLDGTGSSASDDVPRTLDEAVNMFMQEDDKLTVEEAIDKASAEYPELFKRK